ncbi:NUDIX hydrolase domain-like protein [Phlebopus sp. FC_14]|nr:NUDIX hydrolase domain-like protein [Phlebopus sp. FC_14]
MLLMLKDESREYVFLFLSFISVNSRMIHAQTRCIYNLQHHQPPRTRARFPRSHSASVLVALFVGRAGDLYVLLSRRSEALRAYAGDTALPGGKLEPQDMTVEDTARREAFEEIGLPQDKERVPLLCIMEPFLAGNQMIVTPVVVLILDRTLQPNLNSSEVTSIFSHPLVSFLSPTPPPSSRISQGDKSTLDPEASRPYHTFTDYTWTDNDGRAARTRTVRQHSFLTGREGDGIKPVSGLTAAILIHTASISYGRPPAFELQSPSTPRSTSPPTPAHQIAWALRSTTNPLRAACQREGIDPDKQAARLLRPRPPRASPGPPRRRTVGGGSSQAHAGFRSRTVEGWKKMGALWRERVEGVGRWWDRGARGRRDAEQQTEELNLDDRSCPAPDTPASLAGDLQRQSDVDDDIEEDKVTRHANETEKRAGIRNGRGDHGGREDSGAGQGGVRVRTKRDAKL